MALTRALDSFSEIMETTERPNIVSVSWSDHLIFGKGDGRLNSVTSLGRRMGKWLEELDTGIIHWRCTRNRIEGRFHEARGHQHFFKSKQPNVNWDDFEVVPKLAQNFGIKAYLYVSLFDEGWPLLPKKIRETSYHNAMHCQHVSWQSRLAGNIRSTTLWTANRGNGSGVFYASPIQRFASISSVVTTDAPAGGFRRFICVLSLAIKTCRFC